MSSLDGIILVGSICTSTLNFVIILSKQISNFRVTVKLASWLSITNLSAHLGEYSSRKDSKYLTGDALLVLQLPWSILVWASKIKTQANLPFKPLTCTQLDGTTLPSLSQETCPEKTKMINSSYYGRTMDYINVCLEEFLRMLALI